MNEKKQFEKIEKYLNKELSGEEQQKMEELIAQDSALKKEVSLHRDLSAFLSDTKGIELEGKLSLIGAEYAAKYKQNKQSRRWTAWMAAASLLFVLAFGWWYNQSGVNSEQLFAAHYETYISDELERSNSTALSNPMERGLDAYIKEDYKAAVRELEGAIQAADAPDNSHATILFHLAMSSFELQSYEAAKDYLNQLVGLKEGTYTQQAYWYLALIHLKEGNVERSEHFLQQLLSISAKGKYAQQARQLLEEF